MRIDHVSGRVLEGPLEPVYVYEAPVRLWHWVTVVAMFVLVGTGYLIGSPLPSIGGEATYSYFFGYIRMIHFIAAMVFAVMFLVRVYWALVGNHSSRAIFVPPVWNALCDTYHPTQVLADLLTVREVFGRIRGVRLAYVGDGRNNLARSLMIGAAKMGVDLRILAPPELSPSPALVKELMNEAAVGARILVTREPREALEGCDAVYNDVWVSMGEEDQLAERVALLRGFKVTPRLMALTGRPDTIYLHCLPALHDDSTEFARAHPEVCEVADEVFESPQSRVFDQAENRMHTAKAVMVLTV